ncbi:MAG: cupredoxin domain-containing protein [Candidatus Aenigmarchaeota archaeon]|nr:cupredoxin domain-containing protein [Candidatus Aenigmarchaeota archaeon]
MAKNIYCVLSFCSVNSSGQAIASEPVSRATIEILEYGYTPSNLTLKKGSKVSLNLINKDTKNCAQSFTIPSLGIQKLVPPGTSQTIAFTVPSDVSEIPFMCGMGMYRGTFRVV